MIHFLGRSWINSPGWLFVQQVNEFGKFWILMKVSKYDEKFSFVHVSSGFYFANRFFMWKWLCKILNVVWINMCVAYFCSLISAVVCVTVMIKIRPLCSIFSKSQKKFTTLFFVTAYLSHIWNWTTVLIVARTKRNFDIILRDMSTRMCIILRTISSYSAYKKLSVLRCMKDKHKLV